MYAHWSPWRNDDFAAAVISLAYLGFCAARSSALEKESWSWLCVLSVTFCPSGEAAIAAPIAVEYPAASSAPKTEVRSAPPRSRCRSAVPEAIPARCTGTDPVSECDAGVPARPTPIPMKT